MCLFCDSMDEVRGHSDGSQIAGVLCINLEVWKMARSSCSQKFYSLNYRILLAGRSEILLGITHRFSSFLAQRKEYTCSRSFQANIPAEKAASSKQQAMCSSLECWWRYDTVMIMRMSPWLGNSPCFYQISHLMCHKVCKLNG